jgi:hypothetical protein
MSEMRKPGDSRQRTQRQNHDQDVRLRLMAKDGDKIMLALNCNKMVGVLSEHEVMYMFIARDAYRCFIHPLDAEEGRYKAWPVNEKNTAMLKNLAKEADQLFEITPKQNMDPMGVMVAAEKGIIAYLDATGQLPAEDTDFMSWKDAPDQEQGKEAKP